MWLRELNRLLRSILFFCFTLLAWRWLARMSSICASWVCAPAFARAAQAVVRHYVDRLRDECGHRRFAGFCLSDKALIESDFYIKLTLIGFAVRREDCHVYISI